MSWMASLALYELGTAQPQLVMQLKMTPYIHMVKILWPYGVKRGQQMFLETAIKM
jgi:hypothetical protein